MIGEFTLANNVRSTTIGALTAGSVTITVAAASSPNNPFPAPAGGYPGVATLMDSASSPTKIEIVTYTGRSANGSDWDLTGVTRGQFGTSAQSWDSGSIIAQLPIVEMVTGRVPVALIQDIAAMSIIGRSAGSSGVPAAISAAADNTVLRRRSGALGFGTIIGSDIDAAAAIAINKLESAAANSVVGRSSASSGALSFLTAAEGQILARLTGGNVAFSWPTEQLIRGANVETSATSITLSMATHHGATIVCTASSPVTITCPNTLDAWFRCSVIQAGTGRITFSAGSGASVHNVHGHSKTLGQYAQVLLSIFQTGGNKFLLQGETGP